MICVQFFLPGWGVAHRLLRALRLPFGLPFPFGINGRRLSIARASSFSAFGLHHWLVASTSWFTQIWKDFYLLNLLNLREVFAAWLGFVAHRFTQNTLK